MESNRSASSSETLLPIFGAFFFLSGGCGLAYEVLWTRMFGLAIGNETITLCAVLTAFMGGLALGSWLSGLCWRRVRNPLALYGWLELGIGLFVLILPALIRLSSVPLSAVYRTPGIGPYWQDVARFLVSGAIMIVPTTLMGATLPALIGYFSRSRGEVGERTGLLYAINTFGAMFGASATGLLLIPRLGMSHIARGAAAVNIAIGLAALVLSRGRAVAAAGGVDGMDGMDKVDAGAISSTPSIPSIPSTASTPSTSPAPSPQFSAAAVRVCVAAIAVSGAASMMLQVAWTRLFALMIGSSTYSFTLVVVASIGSLALGARIFGRMADRSANPGALFAGLLAVAGFSVFATLFVTNQLPPAVYRLLGNTLDHHYRQWLNEFCIVALVLFGTTFCLGGTFPAVARIAASRWRSIGEAVGAVYAVNTIGAVVGSAAAGLALLPWLELRGCFLLGAGALVGLGAIVGLATARRAWAGALIACVLGAAFGAALYAAPAWSKSLLTSNPFLRLRFMDQKLLPGKTVADIFEDHARSNRVLYYYEGASCTVTVVGFGRTDQIALKVNGKTDASNSASDMPTQLLVGHLACLFHPNPKEGCMIGLGGGFSLGSMETYGLERIDCVEISKGVERAVRRYFEQYNGGALEDPRAHLIIADGRNHLLLTDRTYDVIVSEPSNPWIAGVGSLFTTEFFQLAKSRLKPGGILGQWIHTYSLTMDDVLLIIGSYRDVFGDNILVWQCTPGDYILLGSNEPLRLGWNQLLRRLADPKIAASLGRQGLDNPRALLSGYVGPGAAFAADVEGHPRNTDDYPRLEFSAPISLNKREEQVSFTNLTKYWSPPRLLFAGSPIPDDIAAWMDGQVSRKQRFSQALEWILAGETGKGIPLLLATLQENPYDYSILSAALEALNELAVTVARGGEPDAAIALLQKAAELIALNPKAMKIGTMLAQVQENLAWAYVQKNNPAAAMEQFEKLFSRGDGTFLARQAAIRAYVREGRSARALEIGLSAAPQTTPDELMTLRGLAAYAAILLGSPAAIEPGLQNVPEGDGGSTEIWAAAQSLVKAADTGQAPPTEAAASAKAAVEKDPHRVAILAEACRLANDPVNAKALFEAVLTSDPANSAALLGLAEMALEATPPDPALAKRNVERSGVMKSDSPRAPLLLARAAALAGDRGEARRQADEAQKRLDALPKAIAEKSLCAPALQALRAQIGQGQ
ncbi:MAG: fused MFS/spermidine synthase [Candidatus Sumerlaeota bacterium]|nr:fused MFS/spermidine synthase [Candidatus Sumerlaeota bacterium]